MSDIQNFIHNFTAIKQESRCEVIKTMKENILMINKIYMRIKYTWNKQDFCICPHNVLSRIISNTE